jgi:opacity protein-like surface antigen
VAVGRFDYRNGATVVDVWTDTGGTTTIFAPGAQSEGKDNAFAAGLTVALGADVSLMSNAFLRGEWEYTAFAPVGGIRAQLGTGRLGLGLRF